MDHLEFLLRQFLVPDNEARKQAEEQIRLLSKDPQLVPALLHYVRSAQSPEVRQLAGVLLRKKITGHWMQLSPETRNSVKSTLLESITLEPRLGLAAPIHCSIPLSLSLCPCVSAASMSLLCLCLSENTCWMIMGVMILSCLGCDPSFLQSSGAKG
jgi:hypothetical protein